MIPGTDYLVIMDHDLLRIVIVSFDVSVTFIADLGAF